MGCKEYGQGKVEAVNSKKHTRRIIAGSVTEIFLEYGQLYIDTKEPNSTEPYYFWEVEVDFL